MTEILVVLTLLLQRFRLGLAIDPAADAREPSVTSSQTPRRAGAAAKSLLTQPIVSTPSQPLVMTGIPRYVWNFKKAYCAPLPCTCL